MIHVASTQFSLEKITDENDFWQRFRHILNQAQATKAQIVVFPEYFSLSLLLFQTKGMTFKKALHEHAKAHSEGVLKKAQDLSKEFNLAMVLGTLPWSLDHRTVNRSYFLTPEGGRIFQDKIFMTRFEKEIWDISRGEAVVKTFTWQGATCAILTCYDSEFAVLSQSLAQAQVELLFVPSCTDTENGYWRVRHCCEARAVENQLFVVMSSIVGGDRSHEEIESHYGRAAIFSPCDWGFHANGLVTEGQTNTEGLCSAPLDLAQLRKIRDSGDVLNLRDTKSLHSIPFRNETL